MRTYEKIDAAAYSAASSRSQPPRFKFQFMAKLARTDPRLSGQPLNQAEEEEEQEMVQPPVLPAIPAYKK